MGLCKLMYDLMIRKIVQSLYFVALLQNSVFLYFGVVLVIQNNKYTHTSTHYMVALHSSPSFLFISL